MKRIPRRTLLRGTAGIAVGLPLLEIMGGRTKAQAEVPKRFVGIFTGNGFLPDRWTTDGFSPDFRVGPALEPLAPHRDDLILLRGLRGPSGGVNGGHRFGAQAFLTGRGVAEDSHAALAPSLDQRIASHVGHDTLRSSLELGVRVGGGSGQRTVWSGPGAAIAPENDPAAAFDALFAGFSANEEADDTLADIRSRRASVLDLVHDQFGQLHRLGSTSDRIRLEQHQQAIRELERSLLASPDETQASCSAPERASFDSGVDANIPRSADAHVDIIAYAMACDLTRVATLQFGGNTGGYHHPFLSREASGSWHTVAHDAGDDANAEIERFYASKVARLIDALKTFGSEQGSVFDHTTILWGSEIGRGNHSRGDRAYLVAGSAGGAFRTGQAQDYSDCDGDTCRGTVHHARLLHRLLQAFDPSAESFVNSSGPLDLS